MDHTFANITSEHNIMTLHGQGQVTAIPDIAVLRLGVETTGDNLSQIQEENAEISQNVVEALKQLSISDIRTYQYNINRIIEYEDGRQIEKGYSVRNILEIRMANMELVGMAIDTGVSQGANIVDLIEFRVSDENLYYLQALNLAIENAFQKANSIAESMGILNDPIPIRITENPVFAAPLQSFAGREAVFVTPIEAGNKQIEASVTMEFIY